MGGSERRPCNTAIFVIPAKAGTQGIKPQRLFRKRIESKILGEVTPRRVFFLDQFELPRAPPFLDALLAHNGGFHGVVNLEPDKALHGIASGEPGYFTGSMLMNSGQ